MLPQLLMHRCFDLAAKGFPRVVPNPMVGCVIVQQEQILGEGFHMKFGEPHAEVNAINSIEDKSMIVGSTLYVNLEPCVHFGKTPPCTDLIIEKGFSKVVIAAADPNPLVSGKGIEKLRNNGIEVVCGILEVEAKEWNKRFYTFHLKKRPYIILKWAQTKDGFIADENYQSKWISNECSRLLVHQWRAEEMAIMAGTTTIEKDNPKLTARDWPGNNPVRVLIDKELKLSDRLNVFNDDAEVFIFNKLKRSEKGHLHYLKINFENDVIRQILSSLYKHQIQSLIVEGGCRLLESFMKENLWDEARIFISGKTFNKGIKAPEISGKLYDERDVAGDVLKVFRNLHPSPERE